MPSWQKQKYFLVFVITHKAMNINESSNFICEFFTFYFSCPIRILLHWQILILPMTCYLERNWDNSSQFEIDIHIGK